MEALIEKHALFARSYKTLHAFIEEYNETKLQVSDIQYHWLEIS
jgi:hypothetical protein